MEEKAALKDKVLTEDHQNNGHQGVDRTLELLRQRCYWLGMTSDVKHWCQIYQWCQAIKDSGPLARSFMGHFLASAKRNFGYGFHHAGTNC